MNKQLCIKCRKELPENTELCPFCGTTQTKLIATHQTDNLTATIKPDIPYNENSNPNLISSTKLFLKDSFKINKRMVRADYWWSTLGFSLLYILVFAIEIGLLLLLADPRFDGAVITTILLILLIVIALANLVYLFIARTTAQVRRFHDIALSGTFWLVGFIPVGDIVVLVMLMKASKQQYNPYI